MESFADRLRQAIRASGLTQQQLSDKTEISKSLISSYLAGRYKARSTNLHTLAVVLNVSEAWLMGYNVPRERTKRVYRNYILEDARQSMLEDRKKTIRIDVQEAQIVNALRKQSPDVRAAVGRLLGVEVVKTVTPETVQAVVADFNEKPQTFKIKYRIRRKAKRTN